MEIHLKGSVDKKRWEAFPSNSMLSLQMWIFLEIESTLSFKFKCYQKVEMHSLKMYMFKQTKMHQKCRNNWGKGTQNALLFLCLACPFHSLDSNSFSRHHTLPLPREACLLCILLSILRFSHIHPRPLCALEPGVLHGVLRQEDAAVRRNMMQARSQQWH